MGVPLRFMGSEVVRGVERPVWFLYWEPQDYVVWFGAELRWLPSDTRGQQYGDLDRIIDETVEARLEAKRREQQKGR